MNSNVQERRPLSRPPESIRPGKTVAGKYLLESPLGTGAMGTVWIATHQTLGSKVAVKLVSPDFAGTPETQHRFLAEAKAAASLHSRYVVQMFDSGVTEDGSPYIVMEYLKGESLEERLQRLGRLPLEAAVRILGQVAKGLERAHARSIVHRDLKPANIFLAMTEDGEEVAKILDFGIAKIDHDEKDYKATATGVIMGTPLFMSPEQARGLKSVDHRSDLYSLGMVTYATLVGDVPFHAESFGDLVYMVCTQELPDTAELAPWLPATMTAWFHRACAKDQKQRFSSAEQMYQALIVASQLSRPSLELSALSDSLTNAEPGSGFAGDTPSHGAFLDAARSRGPVATASTLHLSSPDDRAASARAAGGGLGASATRPSTGTQPLGFVGQENTHDGGVVSSGFPGNSTRKRGRGPWLFGGLAVIVAIAGGALWWAGREPAVAKPSPALDTPTNGETVHGSKPALRKPTSNAEGTRRAGESPAASAASADGIPDDSQRHRAVPDAPEQPQLDPGSGATPEDANIPSSKSPRAKASPVPKASPGPEPSPGPKPSPRPVAGPVTATPSPAPSTKTTAKPTKTEPVDLGF